MKRAVRRNPYAKNIALMYAVKLFFWMHFTAAVLVPFYTLWGHISFSKILLLNAWFMIWNFLLEIPTGTVADYFGRKVSILAACALGIIAALVYASVPSFAVFLFAEVIFAAVYCLMSGADNALVYDTLIRCRRQAQSKKILSHMESLKLGGIIIGSLAGALIAAAISIRAPMYCMALPMGIAFIIALFLKEVPGRTSKKSERYLDTLLRGTSYVMKHHVLRILALDMVVVAALSWLIIWFYQKLLMNAGVGIQYFGFVHAGMTAAEIAVIQLMPRVEKYAGGRKSVLTLVACIAGLSFVALAFVRHPALIIIGTISAAAFGLTREPVFSSYMNKYIPSKIRATALSAVSMLRTVVIALVNLIAGLAADVSVYGALAGAGILILLFAGISRVKEEHLLD